RRRNARGRRLCAFGDRARRHAPGQAALAARARAGRAARPSPEPLKRRAKQPMEDRMGETQAQLSGPDLAAGIPASELADGAMLLGHAHGEPVLLARRGDALFAIGATCTHYGGPLVEGLL